MKRVQEIAAEKPAYRTGGTGDDGTCDCVGLIMGAMRRQNGMTYPIHSSNYFARYEMQTLEKLPGAKLEKGSLVYKGRENTAKLNDRYKPGGRYCTGDMLDYYHVGVVESINPMRIVHCTQSAEVDGIARDTNTRGWTHAGRMRGVAYAEGAEMQETEKRAVVSTPDGKKLNVRARPSTRGTLTERIPAGTEVTVQETARNDQDELWSRISHGGKIGYVMAMYLREENSQNEEPKPETVNVTLTRDAAQLLLHALQKAME